MQHLSKYDPLLKQAMKDLQMGEKILVDDGREIHERVISGFEITKLENDGFNVRQFYDPAQTECEVGDFSDIDCIIEQMQHHWL